MPGWFHKNKTEAQSAQQLYTTLVEQARDPAFYTEYGVPDTVDGRFEMLLIHAFLVVTRLKDQDRLAQALFDVMFVDMDRSVREMGVGDLSVSRHVKRMMKAFYGRAEAYEAGLRSPYAAAMYDALISNLYGTVETPEIEILDAVADYIARARAALEKQKTDDLVAGRVSFPPAVAGTKSRKRA